MTPHAAPHEYEVTGQSDGTGTARIFSKGTPITIDSSPALGDALPGPAELLAAAFAACSLKNVERFGQMLPFNHRGAWIVVRAERQDAPPRFTAIHYALHVRTEEPADRVDLLHRNIQQHGTVFNTLAAVCDVRGEIVAEALDAPGPQGGMTDE